MRSSPTRRRTPPLRLAFWLATTSLSVTAIVPASAQPAPPDAAAPGAELAGQPDTNPPPIAGSLAAITGTVSFHAAGETSWSPATLNYPVTNGEGFWTEPRAMATIDIADDRLVLDESTDFEVTTLDQSQFLSTLAQGAIFIQLNSVAQGQTLTVNTPRGAVQIAQAGRYEIVAGDTNDATLVTVVEGAAHVSGSGVELDIGPQQTATIGGTDTFQGLVGPLQQDVFLQAQLNVAVRRQAAALPQQVRYMTGGSELASYGSFSQSAQYGQVWYPSNVASTWAPYREGHWSYVQPWGWTWVDNEPWGFAPFHYGRWAQIEGRWGWIAGGGGTVVEERSYPVYSPALVAFVGVGAASIGFSVGVGDGGYAPAWIPLGPREPYYPWYHTRGDYFARINNPYGVPRAIVERGPSYVNEVNVQRNTTIINNNITNRTNIVYMNQRAATAVPAAAFARGEQVARAARPVPVQALAEARPLAGRLPVRPTAYTPNLPTAAAERYHVTPAARPVQAVAAGPRIVPAVQGAHAAPELRRAALPPNLHAVPAAQVRGQEHAVPANVPGRPGVAAQPPLRPGEATRPNVAVQPALRPGTSPVSPAAHSLPALRSPGARPETAPLHPETAAPRRAEETARPLPGEAGRAAARNPAVAAPEAARREASPRTEANRPGAAVPQAREPAERLRPTPQARPESPHAASPNAAARPLAARPAELHSTAPRPEAARPEPRTERPAVRAESPRPAPREEPARPAPHLEAPRPAPHVEAPRPAPREEAARPAPHAETPRPAPHPEGHAKDEKHPQKR